MKNLPRTDLFSLIVAILMVIASLAGLFVPAMIYRTEELRRSFISNDVVNLFLGLPILLGSLWSARRGRVLGLLFLPGALYYVMYSYIAYVVAMPFTVLFIPYLILVVLSLYTIAQLFHGMDRNSIQNLLKGSVPERLGGGVLIGFGMLFTLRSLVQIVSALESHVILNGPELGLLVADLLIVPTWIIGGVLLWRRKAPGYIAGVGLLMQASMLFIGLLAFFMLQPFVAGVPFPASDFSVILSMGVLCFIPFGLFVRGIMTK